MDTDGRWQNMFNPGCRSGTTPGGPMHMSVSTAMPREAPPDDDGLALELSVYKPWIIERGGSRAVMMIDFRRYDPRSGLWLGWAMSYPHLVSIEYTGDRLVSLNFGPEQIIIEGNKLNALVAHLQRGAVISAQQHCLSLWPAVIEGPLISAIKRVSVTAKDAP